MWGRLMPLRLKKETYLEKRTKGRSHRRLPLEPCSHKTCTQQRRRSTGGFHRFQVHCFTIVLRTLKCVLAPHILW